MKNTKKMMALLLALTLVLGCAIGGTVAYLQMKTDSVVNTFTTSDVSITLEESASQWNDNDNSALTNSYKMVPGAVLAKDPKVTVIGGSEACYVFVEIVESDNFGDYLEYTVADGWTPIATNSNVYYRTVDASNADQEFAVLLNNQVTVKSTVTKTDMAEANGKLPTLTFTAYAIQLNHLKDVTDAAGAWALIPKQ